MSIFKTQMETELESTDGPDGPDPPLLECRYCFKKCDPLDMCEWKGGACCQECYNDFTEEFEFKRI